MCGNVRLPAERFEFFEISVDFSLFVELIVRNEFPSFSLRFVGNKAAAQQPMLEKINHLLVYIDTTTTLADLIHKITSWLYYSAVP